MNATKIYFLLVVLLLVSTGATETEIAVPELGSLVEPCESEVSDSVGWYRSKALQNGYCYKWNWDRGAGGTWTGTRFHCRNLSAHLLWFDSAPEFEFILQTLRILVINSTRSADSTNSTGTTNIPEEAVEIYLNAHLYIYNSTGAAWATGQLLEDRRFGDFLDFSTRKCKSYMEPTADCFVLNQRGQISCRNCLDNLPARFVCKRPEKGSVFPGRPLLRPPECSTCTDRTNKFKGNGWLLGSQQDIKNRRNRPFRTKLNFSQSSIFTVDTNLLE